MNKVAIISSSTGMGKTRELVRIFDENVKNKINTLYITIENRQMEIHNRVDRTDNFIRGYGNILEINPELDNVYSLMSRISNMNIHPTCIIIDSIFLIADGTSFTNIYELVQDVSDDYSIDFIISRQLPRVN